MAPQPGTLGPRRPRGAGSLRQRGPWHWEVRYRDAEGVRRYRSAPTEAEARVLLAAHVEQVQRDVATLADWTDLAAPRRARSRDPRLAAAIYQATALRQLVNVVDDVLALPTLPAGLRDDLALTLAAARTALAATGGGEAAA